MKRRKKLKMLLDFYRYTLHNHEKRGISKTIFKPDEFEDAAFRFRVEENVLKTFWKRRFSKKMSSR